MEKKLTPETAELLLVLSDLKKSKLKITAPRKAILQTLLENHGPFSAEEIHQKITKKICDLATVYRCLASLEKARLIRRCGFGDGATRYELSDRDKQHHHHHVICTECKRVEVLDDCQLGEIDRFARKRGFSGVTHNLEFFGVCPTCK